MSIVFSLILGTGGEEGYLSPDITPFEYQRSSSTLADVRIRGDLEPVDVPGKQAAEELTDGLG